jgi:hypothetical protein
MNGFLEWVGSWQLGTVVAWIAVLPAMVSAFASVRQARKSTAAANDAREALAAALCPIFAFGAKRNVRAERLPVFPLHLTNTSSRTAVDVVFKVTDEDGSAIGEGLSDRIEGTVPGVLGGGPDLVVRATINAEIPDQGDKLTLTFTVRSADDQGIQCWEQPGKITWEAKEQGAQGSALMWTPTRYDHGRPVKYEKSGQ